MKTTVLGAILLLSLQAAGTIAQVQSQPNWSCSGTTCTVSFASNPTTGNLIVVWTFWQLSTGTVTASVADSLGNGTGSPATFPNAVGPTFQPAAITAPTTAQIFYAANIHGGSPDTVTVTFSGSVTAGGAVIVEYSGADQSNPFDSGSAAYSISAGTLLDSGNVAPANSNLLLFGGGFIDNNTGLTAGSGFTPIRSKYRKIKISCRG